MTNLTYEQQDKSHREEEAVAINELIGRKVEVYFNLHKKVFSVRDGKTKRVITHLKEVHIKDAVFRVSEAGRQRVLRDKRKNVHAYVKGELVAYNDSSSTKLGYYNPYTTETFVDKETNNPILEASLVKFINKQVYYSN